MLAAIRTFIARLFGFFRSAKQDREFMEELETHLAMAEEEKIRQGLSPKEARRQARIELGGVTQLREASLEARGLPLLDTFWLDIKLSLRMLRKSWGLTLVGGLAMTVAISVGVIVFWMMEMLFFPTLPLEEGERVVAIQTWDDHSKSRQQTSLADVDRWRGKLRSFEDFGAFQSVGRNLVIDGGLATPVMVAEMTASGFTLTRSAPLMGRPLLAEDSVSGAEPVLVIGEKVWVSKFAGDASIIGRLVELNGVGHRIVGVMPKGFAFPLAHEYWTPLSLDHPGFHLEFLGDGGPEGAIFGRLAPGVTMDGARAELMALGLLPPLQAAETEQELGPRIVPYTFAFTGDFEQGETPWVVRLILILVSLLLVPPCANIAILVYARTINRQEEFASRFALGASRGRIVAQIFIEIWVLALFAAGAALLLASIVGAAMRARVAEKAYDVPFWLDFSLSGKTMLFAAVLALFAAAIAGVIPALKATGKEMQSGFRALGSGTGLRLGKTWTALVVIQVALTLAALPSAAEMGWGTLRKGVLGPGFAAEQYLTAQLAIDARAFSNAPAQRPPSSHFADLQREAVRALDAEPSVSGIAVAASVPGDEPWAIAEAESTSEGDLLKRNLGGAGEGAWVASGENVRTRNIARFNRVGENFFDTYDVPFLSGRAFESGDFQGESRAVIVNKSFAMLVMGGGNPLGRRVRFNRAVDGAPMASSEIETWFEIVGVVADLPAHASAGTLYFPLRPEEVHPVYLSIRTGLEPIGLSERLREITSSLDPALRLDEVVALDEIYRQQQVGNNIGALTLVMVTLSVLLLSAAGIYALMSFTVNQRRREIGIRSALGASPHRLLAGIFRKALMQIGVGAALGSLIALAIDAYLPIEDAGGWEVPGIIPAAALFMTLVGLFAAAGPARRGLRVDPLEELREG